jgi:hypothetical protein
MMQKSLFKFDARRNCLRPQYTTNGAFAGLTLRIPAILDFIAQMPQVFEQCIKMFGTGDL